MFKFCGKKRCEVELGVTLLVLICVELKEIWPLTNSIELPVRSVALLKGMIADKKRSSFSKDFYFSLWAGLGKGAILTVVSKEKIQKAKSLYAQGWTSYFKKHSK